ncbi:MAG: DnaK suppressor protein [Frankiaceae bacterium]|nr:DnaK suppressor protein [Frankiaceae bacterium]MDQ1726127.1 DnaK suppressor protein [Frankiaceae bacterium]
MKTQDARARLEGLLAEIDGSTQVLEGENAMDFTELSSFDQHPADSGTIVADAQRQDAILHAIGDQREQVLAALARLEAGTYGTCVVCGKQLPDERLEARPEAARCVEDQAKFEG